LIIHALAARRVLMFVPKFFFCFAPFVSVLNYPALPVLGRALKISTKEGGWNLGVNGNRLNKRRGGW